MKTGAVLSYYEYDKIKDLIKGSIEDLDQMRKFDTSAGTYPDRVKMRIDKISKALHQTIYTLTSDEYTKENDDDD